MTIALIPSRSLLSPLSSLLHTSPDQMGEGPPSIECFLVVLNVLLKRTEKHTMFHNCHSFRFEPKYSLILCIYRRLIETISGPIKHKRQTSKMSIFKVKNVSKIFGLGQFSVKFWMGVEGFDQMTFK